MEDSDEIMEMEFERMFIIRDAKIQIDKNRDSKNYEVQFLIHRLIHSLNYLYEIYNIIS